VTLNPECWKSSPNMEASLLWAAIHTGEARSIRQLLEEAFPSKTSGCGGSAREHATMWGCLRVRQPLVIPCRPEERVLSFGIGYRKQRCHEEKCFPLPWIDDTLDMLAVVKWFSTVDPKSCYWQVDLYPGDKEKTAFSTGQGLWQFTVLPFGLCKVLGMFEWLMETVLRGLTTSHVSYT
jgi:hypothetical protein